MRSLLPLCAFALILGCSGSEADRGAPPATKPKTDVDAKQDPSGKSLKEEEELRKFGERSRSEEKSSPDEVGRSADEPVHRVDLGSLLRLYEQDEPAADRAWRGKIVQVRGQVESIEGSVVILSVEGVALRCRGLFPGGWGDSATMKTGIELGIRGRVKGRHGEVVLEECSVRQ